MMDALKLSAVQSRGFKPQGDARAAREEDWQLRDNTVKVGTELVKLR